MEQPARETVVFDVDLNYGDCEDQVSDALGERDGVREVTADAHRVEVTFQLEFQLGEYTPLIHHHGVLLPTQTLGPPHCVTADDAEATTAFPFKIEMWTLHCRATYSLTHFFQVREGASLDLYGCIAIDILSIRGKPSSVSNRPRTTVGSGGRRLVAISACQRASSFEVKSATVRS